MTNIEAIGIASVISLLLAYATVLPAMRSVAGAVAAARNFGVTGFVVLFTVAFGAGHGLRIALLSFCMIPFFVSSMSAVVASIPREEWDGARVLRMSRWRAVWEIVVLGKADQAFEVLRQNAAMGWMCLTMVEGLSRSEGGIGIMMLDQNKHFNLPAVFAIQGTIFLVGLFQDAMLAQIRRWACPYADLALERD
jgi:NitT/TauT family transport system permease protein